MIIKETKKFMGQKVPINGYIKGLEGLKTTKGMEEKTYLQLIVIERKIAPELGYISNLL